MLTTLAIQNYRSLRNLVVPLDRLNVVTGANGTGKSSLYRALRLLADASRGGAVAALAREGGLPSTLWAGPETGGRSAVTRGHPVQGTVRTRDVGLRLGFAGDVFGYAIDFGLPLPAGPTVFRLDPEIKCESVWSGPQLRPAAVLSERRGQQVRIRDGDGAWRSLPYPLQPFDSMLSEVADPQQAPELLAVREQIRSWRFYDNFRTDADAPARASRLGTRTPVLADDGADVAAAVQTIREIGDVDALDAAVRHALPGSRVDVVELAGRLEIQFHQPGLLRPLHTAELSDGTLRYLLLTAALLSPRPPVLLVLNEPETSLHRDLQPALGGLIAATAERTQVVAVSHSAPLIDAITAAGDARTIELVKDLGETRVVDQADLHRPPWTWPRR